jgi:hypothetical protein
VLGKVRDGTEQSGLAGGELMTNDDPLRYWRLATELSVVDSAVFIA